MRDLIDLNDLTVIPIEMMAELENYKNAFRDSESLEYILIRPQLVDLMFKIDQYCRERLVVGYHFTKAVPKEIVGTGLTCLVVGSVPKQYKSPMMYWYFYHGNILSEFVA
jgi:hypothetical protein